MLRETVRTEEDALIKSKYQEELVIIDKEYTRLERGIEDGERVTKAAADEIMKRDESEDKGKDAADVDKLTTELDTRLQEVRQNLYTLDVLNEGHVSKLNKRVDVLSNRVTELQDTLNTVNKTLSTIFTILENK